MSARTWIRIFASTIVAGMLATACGEPPIDFAIPDRGQAHVLDAAGALADVGALEAELVAAADLGVDIVVLTYETDQASCGEAFRAGREFVAAWDADVAMVGVAAPGGFNDSGELAEADQRPCIGVQPIDDFALGRGTREEISEVLWPPLIEDRAFDQVFAVGADQLVEAYTSPPEEDQQ